MIENLSEQKNKDSKPKVIAVVGATASGKTSYSIELAKQIKDIVQSIDLNKKEISLREEQEKQKHLI